MSLPEISTVPNLSTTDRANILDALFEPCTALHTLSIDLFHTQTFSSYDDLIASVGMQLTELSESSSTTDTAWLHSILAAHPRLGASKVDSVQSRAEQAQLNTGAADEAEKLKHANDLYEQTFPGLIYVCVPLPPHLCFLGCQCSSPRKGVCEWTVEAGGHKGHVRAH